MHKMENLEERYELALERIKEIKCEPETADEYKDYFQKTAGFLTMMCEYYGDMDKICSEFPLDSLKSLNYSIYADILEDNYSVSYANPEYAVNKLGIYGQVLSFLYSEIRALSVYVFEKRLTDIVIIMELFIQIYDKFIDEERPLIKYIKEAIYYHEYDYADVTVAYRIKETLDPSFDFAKRIVMDSDLSDLRYLYRYGEYISENETKLAEFLNKFSEEEIDKIASTYTEGFKRGFVTMRIDMSPKKTVCIRYAIGQERIVRAAIRQFREMGLEAILTRYPVSRINRRMTQRQGYTGTSANKQYDYDHRMDDTLFLDRAFAERKLEVAESTYEELKELAAVYAGPAVIEVFGENPFNPEIKQDALSYTEKQQELSVELQTKMSQLVNKYIPGDKYSFTIIAYPIPEIGEKFEEIFNETVKVNNLDNALYTNIQQSIIDVLDKSEKVLVKGRSNNVTDVTVMLHELKNPEKETKFENCVADVNIPVGEVFTSPVLKGTNGTLNVSEVYLNGLKYVDLKITFKDGMISDYTCSNFDSEEENKKYIKENLLYNRQTLPIGEFAIGTNTTAYVMANKYDILYKLPILIVEKTGPHFAVGDTCYSHSEDNVIFNPDGKEIVAKENECSVLRHEDMSKAYFNCHTDITIPYDEIGEICAVDRNGNEIPVIINGRFVLKGTEPLNEVFDN